MALDEALEARFDELLASGSFPFGTNPFWVVPGAAAQAHEWLVAVVNLIGIVTNRRGIHWEQANEVMTDKHLSGGVPQDVIRRMRGVLSATNEDRKRGLLRDVVYTVFAEAFDDFLDRAAAFHKGGKLMEAAILASAVLEDTMKQIARKSEVDPNRSLEPLIDDLIKEDVLSPVQGKRVKAWAGVRNHAFHAEWDELDLQSVGEAINGVRELIQAHLD